MPNIRQYGGGLWWRCAVRKTSRERGRQNSSERARERADEGGRDYTHVILHTAPQPNPLAWRTFLHTHTHTQRLLLTGHWPVLVRDSTNPLVCCARYCTDTTERASEPCVNEKTTIDDADKQIALLTTQYVTHATHVANRPSVRCFHAARCPPFAILVRATLSADCVLLPHVGRLRSTHTHEDARGGKQKKKSFAHY